MKREVVQDFLNLPGIAGVALIDGRSRPYFCGVDQTLNFQQKEALSQGIQQVVETTPADFQFFKFQFSGHQIYIYKLDHGVILLVLATSDLIYSSYAEAIGLLKIALRADTTNAIATFRLLAGNITLSNDNYWKRRSDVAPTGDAQSVLPAEPKSQTNYTLPRSTVFSSPASSSLELPLKTPGSSAPPIPPVTQPHLKELLTDLNHLSQFTAQYLGTTVITNYWKTSRPAIDWLSYFEIDRSAQISFSGPSPSSETQVVSPEQLQAVREWVTAFITRCSKVIRDFPTLIQQTALDDRQKILLLTK